MEKEKFEKKLVTIYTDVKDYEFIKAYCKSMGKPHTSYISNLVSQDAERLKEQMNKTMEIMKDMDMIENNDKV